MKRTLDNVKLGIFVLAGAFLLILTLYLIGKNSNLFGTYFTINVHFENVGGLMPGNGVRYSGIGIGTVKEVNFLNDTTIEAVLSIETRMQQLIRKNAIASLGTDGLIGNRIININPAKEPAPFIEPNDVLIARKELDMDEMLRTLNRTNNNVAAISEDLRSTVHRINNSTELFKLLDDRAITTSIKSSLANIDKASAEASAITRDLHGIIQDVEAGKGSVGSLLRDTTLSHHLEEAVLRVESIESQISKLTTDLDSLVLAVRQDVTQGPGPAHTVLRDTAVSNKVVNSLANIEKGTAAFSENMEALKHNFLFRGYFKKQEKKAKKAAGNQ